MPRFAELCPGVPIHIETISGVGRDLPFLEDAFWTAWPRLEAQSLARFMRLMRRKAPMAPTTTKPNDAAEQRRELETQPHLLPAARWASGLRHRRKSRRHEAQRRWPTDHAACGVRADRVATSATAAAAHRSPHRRTRATRAGAKPRNIVFILTDDHRYDALGFMGHPLARTPNMDALAKGGAHMRNAFVTTALCSPSRASILTGTYAHTHGVVDNFTPIPPGLPNVGQLLKQAGYQTALIGKWHIGDATDAPQPGFDRWVSFRGQGEYLPRRRRDDAQRRRHARAAEGLHHRRTHRLRHRLARQDVARQAVLPVSVAQGRARRLRAGRRDTRVR